LTDLNINANEQVLQWCVQNKPNLIAIGPEDPLAQGLVDVLLDNGFNCFGPSRAASQIECDKAFAKRLMEKYHLPTAKYRVFNDANEALHFLDNPTFTNPLVIKAAGLALGKGVVVAENIAEAKEAVRAMLERNELGAAGSTLVIEQLLTGHEFSVLAFSDGQSVKLLPTAQDHKRAYFKDQGPNTGGMGAISPFPLLSAIELKQIETNIMLKTVQAMEQEKCRFIGVLFAGVMLTSDGPQLLEFNCRFGDPETQTVLPLLQSDLYEVMLSCAQGHKGSLTANAFGPNVPALCDLEVRFSSDCAISVVLASGGYPRTSTKHQIIRHLNRAVRHAPPTASSPFELHAYHAATYVKDDQLYTNGGRVLSIVGRGGQDLPALAAHVQQAVTHVQIDKFFYRTDIGERTFRVLSGRESMF
jgi:phosphoribosylamine--glycine ligase